MTTRASGLLIYRKSVAQQFEFLLLKCSRAGHWTPPKGHVDAGENERQTAIRETREESGLLENQYKIDDRFEKVVE